MVDITQNDKELLDKAHDLDYVDWSLPLAWIDNADSEDTKEKLKTIAVKLYRREEEAAGLL